MADIIRRQNEPLMADPSIFHHPDATRVNTSVTGSDWYWVITIIMTLFTSIVLILASRVTRGNRIFHHMTVGITLVPSITYFMMASNLGWADVHVEFIRSKDLAVGIYRQVFYVRHLEGFVTTPLILLNLLLTARLPLETIFHTLLWAEIMVATTLAGSLVASSYKWSFFAIAVFARSLIAWTIAWDGIRNSLVTNNAATKTFIMCGSLTLLVWFTYPVAWALGEGSNVISPDAEAIFYGLLDIISKPVFGGLLLWGHRDIDPASLGLSVHNYEGSIYSDKSSVTIPEPVMLGDMAPRGSTGAIQTNGNESAV